MDKCNYLYDQRQIVLKGIRRLDKTFVPVYKKPNMNYDCVLVNGLNPDKIHEKKGVYNESEYLSSPAKGVISMEELEVKIERQIKNETRGTIEIKNIEVKEEPTASVLLYVSLFIIQFLETLVH